MSMSDADDDDGHPFLRWLAVMVLIVGSAWAIPACPEPPRTPEQERIDKFLNDCELVDNGQWQFSDAAGR